MLFELSRHEVHEEDAVADRTGGCRVGLRLPQLEVRVVHDHKVDSLARDLLNAARLRRWYSPSMDT